MTNEITNFDDCWFYHSCQIPLIITHVHVLALILPR
jgi:hypothetical protein